MTSIVGPSDGLFYWNPWALLMASAAAVEMAFAAWVFAVRPERAQNRRLAMVIFADGVFMLGGGAILYSTRDASIAYGAQMMAFFALILWYPAQIRFVSTLDSPLARPLRTWGSWLALAAAAAMGAGFFLRPETVMVGLHETWYSTFEVELGSPVGAILVLGIPVVCLFALAVTVSALRRTKPGTLRRRQAKAFALGFLVRDSILAIIMPIGFVLITDPSSRLFSVVLIGQALASFSMAALLGIGMLRTQLFGFDLRLKWTIKRGSVAGIILATFFMVSVVAENYLTGQFGWAVGGIVAGLLLFAIAPLQRLGERIANVALPNVQDTAAYRDQRAREIYAAACEAAMKDGVVTDKERDVLATLQEELGIKPTEALAIERGVG